jgi:Fe-S cluster assembly protein SufD
LSSGATAVVVQDNPLYDRLATLPGVPFTATQRRGFLDAFFATHSGREKPGRYWRRDFETLQPSAEQLDGATPAIEINNPHAGVAVYDLATAARECPALLARAFGRTRAHATRFGALAAAFAQHGVFIHVPADRAADEPIVVRYIAAANSAMFPACVVLAERGARVTIVEEIDAGANAFVCGTTEIVSEESAHVSYAVVQSAADDATVVFERAALPGRNARLCLADAELGAGLAAGDLSVAIEQPGSETEIVTLFFPAGSQHVDVISTVDHRAGDATSETLVKSAGTGHGQARFLGNIRIAAHAQKSDARLRDDALLLSETAHVDSVPALEIAANDVKAYHGATVGAIDDEQIFYMESRGIQRSAAERMIALGFFEPAIARFPGERVRDLIRAALAAKLT